MTTNQWRRTLSVMRAASSGIATVFSLGRRIGTRVNGSSSLFLLYLSQPQLVLQSRHDLTRMMIIKSSEFVAAQPSRASPALDRGDVDLESLLDHAGDQATHRR